MQVEKRRVGFYLVVEAVGIPSDQAHPDAFVRKDRQLFRPVVIESGGCFLILFRQCDPGLYHLETTSGKGLRILKPFGMCNAFSCGHPVHLSRPDDLLYPEAIQVRYGSPEKIADGRQPDMRM